MPGDHAEVVDVVGEMPDGRRVERLVLGGEPGVELHLLTLGSTVQRLRVTGGDGVRRDVALGYADVASYLAGDDYLGAVVGRYANRIAHGRFELDGEQVQVGVEDRGHSLHGGPDGFDDRLWEVVERDPAARPSYAVLRLVSPDGDQGFPGRLTADARWEVEGDVVRLVLSATTDATTVVNLTSHLYLNLDGDDAGTVDHHELRVPASAYLPVDATAIPLGEQAPVDGTPFDLRTPTRVADLGRADHPQLRDAQGIDHDLVVDGEGMRLVAELSSARTRTRALVRSDRPGLQVYAGNFLDGTTVSRAGRLLRQGDGLALEPQLHPDSPHHLGEPGWPSPVLRPGETATTTIEWELGALPG